MELYINKCFHESGEEMKNDCFVIGDVAEELRELLNIINNKNVE